MPTMEHLSPKSLVKSAACPLHPRGDHRLRSRYGLETTLGRSLSCENEVAGQLVELYAKASELARLDGRSAADAFFNAGQNARRVRPLTPRP